MTRRDKTLLAVIAVELAVGGALAYRAHDRPAPPIPELSHVDPFAAKRLRARAAKCETADEWAALGEAYLAFGYFAEGEACYRTAATDDPTNPLRAAEWAFALERIGKLTEANAEYRRAIPLGHPHPDECQYYVGRNALRLGDVAAAREAFAGARAQPSARYELARLLVRDGDQAGAVESLQKLTAEYPRAYAPYFLLHRVEALNNSPQAAKHAELALSARERLPTPFDRDWKRLEDVYFRDGATNELKAVEKLLGTRKLADAETKIRAVIATEWSASAADLLAEIELLKGKPAEAVRLLQDAVEKDGPSGHLLARLGDAHEANGKPDLAATFWARATELGIGAAVKDLHYRLGEYHAKANNAPAARWHQSRAYFAAGHDLYWRDQFADARVAFGESVKLDATYAPAWFYLGESCHRLTDEPAAKSAYRKCLAIDPNFGRAIAALAR